VWEGRSLLEYCLDSWLKSPSPFPLPPLAGSNVGLAAVVILTTTESRTKNSCYHNLQWKTFTRSYIVSETVAAMISPTVAAMISPTTQYQLSLATWPSTFKELFIDRIYTYFQDKVFPNMFEGWYADSNNNAKLCLQIKLPRSQSPIWEIGTV